ncbi:MAG: heat-inducible transcription repressor HrcA [Ktedonobacterales bacterium]|nr:heat-inducible transcription repressor HrcA [Ktedonobacterales bacterium]
MEKRLNPRKDAILRALVEEYIRTAEPVASQPLAEKYQLGYSSATVRIDLKALEEDGFVYQRHSSGGRIPTDLGYRYFVERLMPESTLGMHEQRLIRHQFYQVQYQLDQWVRLSASILSQALGSAAVVTIPRASEGRLKHFEMLSLNDTIALLVLVLRDGSLSQGRLFLPDPATQEDLSRLSQGLNARFGGQSGSELGDFVDAGGLATLTPNEQVVTLALVQHISRHTTWGSEDVYQEGLTRMLGQPEFTRLGDEQERGERIRKVVEALEQNALLPMLQEQLPDAGGVQVVIGGETDLHDLSIVVGRYGLPGMPGGLLGVVGPTRMQYSKAVALVRYMTDIMNDLLADYFGSGGATPDPSMDGEGPTETYTTKDHDTNHSAKVE